MTEVQNMKVVVESASSLLDEVLQGFSSFSDLFLEFESSMDQNSVQWKSIICNHEKLHFSMKQELSELENQKLLLQNQSVNLQNQIEELRLEAQNHETSLMTFSEQRDLEKSEFLDYIQCLETEISGLSSCSLAKEKETLRKDLEKTKTKLKETEFKLKNAIQEKTKLEGEKAFAEREIKRLHGQKTLLERGISKQDSIASKRRDSTVERSSKVFDRKRAKSSFALSEQKMQEDYEKLEVLAFEMETTIASLEEKLAMALQEKEEAISRNVDLASELESISKNLDLSSSELTVLQEEVSGLRCRLEESSSDQKKMESSIKVLLEEKEELARQLTNSLLEIEEAKAIWCCKEKASVKAFDEKAEFYHSEIKSLLEGISEVKNELQSCREECEVLRERLAHCEEDARKENKWSEEKSLEIDRVKNNLKLVDAENKQSQEALGIVTLELQHAHDKVDMLQKELISLKIEREDLLVQHGEFDKRLDESNEFQDKLNNGKEKAKLRMKLRGTQAQLDAFRFRYQQAMEELDLMNRKFEEASANLKNRLASKGLEVLNLKKQLAAATVK
ncbi:kinesin-like protein KIN-7O [Carica papaya]|uniref:kinesin-like protein KIN-7O n=1 Tax=Carica papaya TaxID=3649 RepID=UPI000B8CAA6C|nr:kinesin-like protein KIN-7O [Carica papaya]